MVKYNQSMKNLWSNCLKMRQKESTTEFHSAAEEMCQKFMQDSELVRQLLPNGLDHKEVEIIRATAVKHGLAVINRIKYGREDLYLTKSNL